MNKTCPQCSAQNPANHFTCEHCGSSLTDNGMLIDAVTYWDQKKRKNVAIRTGILLAGVAATIAVHHILPLAVGLAAAGIAYLRASAKEDAFDD